MELYLLFIFMFTFFKSTWLLGSLEENEIYQDKSFNMWGFNLPSYKGQWGQRGSEESEMKILRLTKAHRRSGRSAPGLS